MSITPGCPLLQQFGEALAGSLRKTETAAVPAADDIFHEIEWADVPRAARLSFVQAEQCLPNDLGLGPSTLGSQPLENGFTLGIESYCKRAH